MVWGRLIDKDAYLIPLVGMIGSIDLRRVINDGQLLNEIIDRYFNTNHGLRWWHMNVVS